MLPIDILRIIFNNLCNKEIIKLSFVCKYFNEIISDDIFWHLTDKTKNRNIYNSLLENILLRHRLINKRLICEKKIDNCVIYDLYIINKYVYFEVHLSNDIDIYDHKLNLFGTLTYIYDHRNDFYEDSHNNNDNHNECNACNSQNRKYIEATNIKQYNEAVQIYIDKYLSRKTKIICSKNFEFVEYEKYKGKSYVFIKNIFTGIIDKYWNNRSILTARIIYDSFVNIYDNIIKDLYNLLPCETLDFNYSPLYFDINENNIVTFNDNILRMYEY